MFGMGTIINTAAIIVGGVLGLFFGRLLKDSIRDTLTVTCGVATIFIGISGALEGMLAIENGAIAGKRGVFIVVCLILGAVVGEIIDFESLFERFGEWLKIKTGSARDKRFVEGFITASFTVCIGAMAIVGSIQDGIYGDYSILFTKAILDFIIIMVMAASMGKGAIFSFIPVFALQGLMTLLSRVIQPILTDNAMTNLSMIGSILIFCVGINLVWGKKVKVANLLPALIFAVGFAFLPFSF